MSTIQPNFFSSEFFELIRHKRPDFPLTFEAGTTAGPWMVHRDGDKQWSVRRAVGGDPVAATEYQEIACLLAAALPLMRRDPRYSIDFDGEGRWKLILPWGEAGPSRIASLTHDDQLLLPVVDVLHSLLVCPESIAWLLLAAPLDTLDQVGALVAARLNDLPG